MFRTFYETKLILKQMSQRTVRRLRPYLFSNFNRTQRTLVTKSPAIEHDHATHDYVKRVEHLESVKEKKQWYPRLQIGPAGRRLSIAKYNKLYEQLEKDETKDERQHIVGKIHSIRTAGSKLIFVTILDDDHTLQVVLKHGQLTDGLKEFHSIARKGDTYSFEGNPHRTSRGQLSLLATETPQLLAPSLHQIPDKLTDSETISHHRYVHMLVDPNVRQVLKARHTIEKTIDDFLDSRDFTKVNTPILQSSAGGAVARPFETLASELPGRKLQLRIAPELWLKRLIIGGMSRVYEMGPVFRNEGVDSTHNPEFTMCEFYATHTTLQELIQWTEQLVVELDQVTKAFQQQDLALEAPFSQLEFIPTLESRLGQKLPDLESSTASDELKTIFTRHNIELPRTPSFPRLLDALAGHCIEPLCGLPTFITNHPAALSPLSKQFRCPTTNQLVSARAELFINHTEIANMYEEQNSPFEQRQAFIDQLKYRALDGDGDAKFIDNAYLEALEWGLPPTGGWGCGVDRLVMLFTGKSRLGDVLSFGGLRNVVGIGRGR